jgi:hypothetical protein
MRCWIKHLQNSSFWDKYTQPNFIPCTWLWHTHKKRLQNEQSWNNSLCGLPGNQVWCTQVQLNFPTNTLAMYGPQVSIILHSMPQIGVFFLVLSNRSGLAVTLIWIYFILGVFFHDGYYILIKKTMKYLLFSLFRGISVQPVLQKSRKKSLLSKDCTFCVSNAFLHVLSHFFVI